MYLKTGNECVKECFGLKGQKVKEKNGKMRLYLEGSQTTGIAIKTIAKSSVLVSKDRKQVFYPFVIGDAKSSQIKNLALNVNSLGTRLLLNKEVAQSFFVRNGGEEKQSLAKDATKNTKLLIERVRIVEAFRKSTSIAHSKLTGFFTLSDEKYRVFINIFHKKEISIIEQGKYLGKGSAGAAFSVIREKHKFACKLGKWALGNEKAGKNVSLSFEHENGVLNYIHKQKMPCAQDPFELSFLYKGFDLSSLKSHQQTIKRSVQNRQPELFVKYEAVIEKISMQTAYESDRQKISQSIDSIFKAEKLEIVKDDIEKMSGIMLYCTQQEEKFAQIIALGTLYAEGDLDKRGSLGLSTEQKIKICAKLSRALPYFHHKGIYHRDIKPLNIFLDEKLEPVFADFGVAFCKSLHKKTWKKFLAQGTATYINVRLEKLLSALEDKGSFEDFQYLNVLRDCYALALSFRNLQEGKFISRSKKMINVDESDAKKLLVSHKDNLSKSQEFDKKDLKEELSNKQIKKDDIQNILMSLGNYRLDVAEENDGLIESCFKNEINAFFNYIVGQINEFNYQSIKDVSDIYKVCFNFSKACDKLL